MRIKFNKQVFRGLLLVTAFALGIFAFSGCIGQEEEIETTTVTGPSETITSTKPVTTTITPVTLSITGPWSGAEMEGFLPVLDAFTADTGIAVDYKIMRAEDLQPILPAQFAAKMAPADVLFMWDWYISENTEHFVDVSDIVDPNDFMGGTIDRVTVGGKVYGSSYTGKIKPGFWYRLSFFEEHDLEVPTTWDEFVALLDTIKGISGIETAIASGDGVGWPLSDVTEHFILTFGGQELFYDLIDGTVSWTSDAVQDIFENRLVPIIEAGHFSEPKQWDVIVEDWWTGKHALYFMGSWITGMVADPDDLGVFALPGADAFVFNPDYFGIPKYTKHLAEAKLLFQFLGGAKAQEIQVAQGGHVATNVHVSLDSYPDVDRRVAALLEGAAAVHDLDDTVGGEFQTTFWSQLQWLWVHPEDWATVLTNIEAKAP